MNRLTDAFIIVRSLWLVLLFLFLSLFAFLLADQSVDVLWSVVEDATVTGKKNFTSSAFMLLALLFWSVSTKFTVRLIIYMSDNSSIGLSPDRVAWRKRFQNWIIKASGYIPVLVVWMGFGMAVVYNLEYMDDRKWIYIAVLFVFFVLILFRGSLLYDFFRSLRWFSAWIAPVKEKDIYHKLQGIFEPIRINLPFSEGLQPSDFIREAQNKDQSFLPQHLVFVGSIQREGGIAVGMVRLKATYFKTLFSRFWALFILSVGVLALAVWIDQPQFFHRLGSLGIICAALGTWQVFYLGLHILDDLKPIWGFGYYRLVLFIYFVACSYFNEDHPVFIYSSDHKQQDRPYLDQHFAQWFDALEKRVHATGDTTGKVPVIFIAAEGGALRTGAFTAATLAYLQEQNPFFREHLYTLSGVSGGSLGLSVFYAMNYRSEVPSKELPASTKVFFEGDFLSVTIAKLAFAEILGYFLPVYWPKTDRAIALERAWEDQYKLACDTGLNALTQPFHTLWSSSQQGPALFINTTNAETGQQAYFSNVRVFKVDKYDSTVFGDQDIQRHWFRQINMSSAINFSTRFPLVSPSAAITIKQQGNTVRRHYVDGGYYENSGADRLLELLQYMQRNDAIRFQRMDPIIIQFNFGESTQKHSKKDRGNHLFNEIHDVVAGLYNVRGSKTQICKERLRAFANSYGKKNYYEFTLDLNTKDFPMNWTLSTNALEKLGTSVKRLVHNKHITPQRLRR